MLRCAALARLAQRAQCRALLRCGGPRVDCHLPACCAIWGTKLWNCTAGRVSKSLTDKPLQSSPADPPTRALLSPPGACQNVFAAHPGVIRVGASDSLDQASALGPADSPCIDIWAPGGGVGTGLIGADSLGPKNYTKVINR